MTLVNRVKKWKATTSLVPCASKSPGPEWRGPFTALTRVSSKRISSHSAASISPAMGPSDIATATTKLPVGWTTSSTSAATDWVQPKWRMLWYGFNLLDCSADVCFITIFTAFRASTHSWPSLQSLAIRTTLKARESTLTSFSRITAIRMRKRNRS